MRTPPFALAALVLLASGCQHAVTPPAQPPRFSNAQAYDAFVVKRADELYAGGKFNSRQAAASAARQEADRRYGARTRTGDPVDSAATVWRSENPKGLSLAELDATVAQMKKERTP